MEGYVHITFDLSNYSDICNDIAVNARLTCFELVKIIFDSYGLDTNQLDNIVLKILRNGYIVSQSETLQECGVRDGDVVTLL